MNTLLLIIVLLILFGGGGFYFGGPAFGEAHEFGEQLNIGGAAGPYFASWAHRHLGVENVYRVAAISVFAMFFVVLFFFREPRQAGDAPPPSIAMRQAS